MFLLHHQMTYSELLELATQEEYQTLWKSKYCKHPIVTFDGIRVRFRINDFEHAFYESVLYKDDTFSWKRAQRIKWIEETLQDPTSERFVGWNSAKRKYDYSRRVAIVKESYVVVIGLLEKGESEARFITAYVADSFKINGKPSTIDKIRSGPQWEKNPLIRQAGSAEKPL
jgi:hypothetical protein